MNIPFNKNLLFCKLFERQAQRTPGNTAVVQDNRQLTYRELDGQANRIANYLHAQGYLKPESIVAFLGDQSIEMLISLPGILKAGFAFLILDPSLPEQRLQYMLHEADVKIILSTKKHIGLLNRLQWDCSEIITFLCLDSASVCHEAEETNNDLMDTKLWDYVGGSSSDRIGRGGWKNSYTGELFSEKEVRECGENVFQKLKPYLNKDTRVLEIGCSSGITMFQIAPHVGFYYGTDISEVILRETQKQAEKGGYPNIRLKVCAAHEIESIDEKDFDIILMNSVVQAFHGHNYLRQVIEKSVRLLKNSGVLFIGDVMNLDSKDELIHSLQKFKDSHRSSGYLTKTDVSNELFLSPSFFCDLTCEQKALKSCSLSKKFYTIENELTKYRYDVLFQVDRQNTDIPTARSKYQHDLTDLMKFPMTHPSIDIRPENLAYVIFTSGTEGQPKGVLVEHRSLVNLCLWYDSCHSVSDSDRCAKFASGSFDACLLEIFPPLLAGASIYLLDPQTKMNLLRLNAYFEDNRITIAFLPTPYAEQFMELENHSLRLLNVGGERLKKYRKRNYRVINNYGPAECAVVSAYYEVSRQEQNIPIGKPITNVRLCLMADGKPITDSGTEGEIYISGINLARGYLKNAELTKDKFIEDPSVAGERAYRTGDIAYYNADKELVFVRRTDEQVKIRGCRIELGEIESNLIAHEDISQCAVLAVPSQKGDPTLCACLVLKNKLSVEEMKAFLSKRLPSYMIPEKYIPLDSMPTTANGKIDRKALLKFYSSEKPAHKHKACVYQNDTEKKVAALWEQVLETTGIGPEDSFFELGGNSLKVIMASALIEKEFGVELTAAQLFKARTVREQSRLIPENQTSAAPPPLPKAERMNRYPVPSAQKRLFVIQQMNRGSTAYNMPFAFTMRGEIDVSRFRKALGSVMEKHEILRTDFRLAGGTVVQRISDAVPLPFEYEENSEPDFDQITKEFVRPFDCGRAPLWRARLIRTDAEAYLLLFDIHHILMDGSSTEIFWEELSKAYNGEGSECPAYQFRDYAAWQKTQNHQKESDYWKKQLGGLPVLNLPYDDPRPLFQSYEGAVYRFQIRGEVTKQLKAMAQSRGVSMNMLLLAAYTLLLSQYSGQEDIPVGIPVYGRSRPEFTDIIGMFVNTIVFRGRPEGKKRFIRYLEEVRQTLLEALDHQDCPFEDMVDQAAKGREAGRNPLFDTMFVMQRFSTDKLKLKGLEIHPQDLAHTTSRFDMTWFAEEDEGGLHFTIEYATKLFRQETIARLADHYSAILNCILLEPAVLLSDIERLTPSEKNEIFHSFQSGNLPYPQATIQEIFKKTVMANKNKTALVFQQKRMTYEELDRRSNQVACFLQENGIGPESIVVLFVNKSAEMIVGLLGILKARAACLPISPDYPDHYIQKILCDSKPSMVLTNADENRCKIFETLKCSVISIQSHKILSYPMAGADRIARPDDLLYCIYTSGTTGKPKGILIENKTLSNLILYQQNRTNADFSGVLQFASITFDVAFQEIFSCFLSGGKLLIPTEEERMNIHKLFQCISREAIPTLYLPPAVLHTVFQRNELIDEFPRCVKHIIAAGESLTIPDPLKQYMRENHLYLHNHYGPSETHVVTALTICPQEIIPDRPSIGRPIDNCFVVIVDPYDRPLPIGVTGELCVGGDSIGRGYLNLPDTTKEKFRNDPFHFGEKLYHSGDLARWLPDGCIEYICRTDSQIKIRGFRIETSAVENELYQCKNVKQALVAPFSSGHSTYLCAYIVTDKRISPEDLRHHLSQNMPSFMVPQFYIFLDAIPITAHGKVDRKALPKPAIFSAGEPQNGDFHFNDTERKVAVLWEQVLEATGIGPEDSFFELGGNSLKVIMASALIEKEFGVELTAAQLFKARTVREQSRLILENQTSAALPPIPKAGKMNRYPVPSAQKRLFVIQQMNRGSTAYNMPFAFTMRGEIDVSRFREALGSVMEKHEILRTDFRLAGGTVEQRISDAVPLPFEYEENSEPDFDQITKEFVRPFDCGRAPLWRARLIQTDAEAYLLLFDIHHILMDGSSTEIFWEELSKAYNGVGSECPAYPFRDYAAWQNTQSHQKERDYWKKQLGGELPVLDLPYDFPRPPFQSYEGAVYRFQIRGEVTKQLKAMAQNRGVSMNMLLLAAYTLLLSQYSGQEDIPVGIPVYGRSRPEFTNIIGMFVNTIVFRGRPKGKKRFIRYLEEVRQTLLEALDHQDYPFEDMVDQAAKGREAGRNPLFDTMFVMQRFSTDKLKLKGLEIHPQDLAHTTSRFDMTWFAEEDEGGLHFAIEYATKLFRQETIARLADHYSAILNCILLEPAVLLSDIERLPKREKNKLLQDDAELDNKSERYQNPRGSDQEDLTEQKLSAIWKEILGIKSIDADDDFFRMGGDSLKAILLADKLEKKFGIDVSGSVVFQWNTVRKMTRYFSGCRPIAFSSLVEIRKAKPEKNLFCIHPAPGTVICYQAFSQFIREDWSVYGLQSRGCQKGHSPAATVEEMAADYIKEIRKRQAKGPYYLLGWSVGGRIAYEMAQQLTKDGEKVEYLFLLDTDPKFIAKANHNPTSLSMYPYAVAAMFGHAKTILGNLNITSFRIGSLYRRILMWIKNIRAVYLYRPAPYLGKGRVILLQTREGEKIERKLKNKSRSIKSFIPELEILPIGCNHLEMLSGNNGKEICEILNPYLDQ